MSDVSPMFLLDLNRRVDQHLCERKHSLGGEPATAQVQFGNAIGWVLQPSPETGHVSGVQQGSEVLARSYLIGCENVDKRQLGLQFLQFEASMFPQC